MGGGNISDYALLVVPYTSRGVWGHAPQKSFGALRQLLLQSDAKSCYFIDIDEPSIASILTR